MTEFTDETVERMIRSDNSVMLGVLICFILVFVLFLAVGIKGFYDYKIKAKPTVKSFLSDYKSLIITAAVIGLISVLLSVATAGAFESADEWHMEYLPVTEMKIEIDSSSDTRTRTYHILKVEGFHQEIKVSKEEYETVETGEKVYVLVFGDTAYAGWAPEVYRYTGKRLVS